MTVKERLHRIVEALPDEIPRAAVDETENVLRRYINGKSGASADEPVSYLALAEELARQIPPEIVETIPTDLAENHDHYAYGTPKKH